MRDESYIVIQGWMVNNLHLSGNELLVYALIFGFSQDGESKYEGSHKYIAESCGLGLRTVPRILDALIDRNLILKDEYYKNNIKFCRYYANINAAKMAGGMPNWQGGTAKMADNNITNNIENNNMDFGLGDSNLDKAIKLWFSYKKERRQSYKKTGAVQLITKCRKYATIYGEDAVIKIIEDSISSNYMGIVFDRLERMKPIKPITPAMPEQYSRSLN